MCVCVCVCKNENNECESKIYVCERRRDPSYDYVECVIVEAVYVRGEIFMK